MKYGQHYQTPKNNNGFANTNPFLKDYFIYFLVEVFSVCALFSLEEVRLRPSHLPIQLIRFLLSLHFQKFVQNTQGNTQPHCRCLSPVWHPKGKLLNSLSV